MNTQLQTVIDKLRQKGYKEEQIQKLKNILMQAASVKLQAEMISSFTNEDMQVIEKLDQKEAETKIKKLFEKLTGKKAEDFAAEFYANFAKGFLEKYNQKQ